ncbi:MAG: nuclear transport factor 2 family protein [Candidatus Latescibacterota bacterium]|nr:MAG: nuclear transport factor 2 family protein [Candidatus Latescibacterota bacterium]
MNQILRSLLMLVTVAALVAPASLSAADEAELAAIEQTARDYLEGGTNGDVDRLRRAFHSSCVLKFTRHGAYQEWPVQDYLARIRPGRRSQRSTHILFMDFAGSCAVVKVRIDDGERTFIDFLSLLKIDEEWKIVGKIFYRQDLNSATSGGD